MSCQNYRLLHGKKTSGDSALGSILPVALRPEDDRPNVLVPRQTPLQKVFIKVFVSHQADESARHLATPRDHALHRNFCVRPCKFGTNTKIRRQYPLVIIGLSDRWQAALGIRWNSLEAKSKSARDFFLRHRRQNDFCRKTILLLWKCTTLGWRKFFDMLDGWDVKCLMFEPLNRQGLTAIAIANDSWQLKRSRPIKIACQEKSTFWTM